MSNDNSSGKRVVMVTGAAGNLGRAVAQAFADAGDRLVLVDRHADALTAAFGADGDGRLSVPTNLLDRQQARRPLLARPGPPPPSGGRTGRCRPWPGCRRRRASTPVAHWLARGVKLYPPYFLSAYSLCPVPSYAHAPPTPVVPAHMSV